MSAQMVETSRAAQAPSGGGGGGAMADKMAEQEKLLEHKSHEIEQLMVSQ